MPVLVVIEVLIQIFFAVHVVKTGRNMYWLFIIFIFPGLGCLVYFIVEFLPDFQQDMKIRRARAGTIRVSGKKLREMEDQVELTPSVRNKKTLAEAYVHLGMFEKAIPLYEDCLKGTHNKDPFIMEGLCLAYFFKKDFKAAKTCLEKLMTQRETSKNDEFDLLMARVNEELGDIEAARKKYAALVPVFSGEEARCRYAMLLKGEGEVEAAGELFNEILKNARVSPKFYRRAQKKWIDIAKKEIGR